MRLIIDASVIVASLRAGEPYTEAAWRIVSRFLRGELELLSLSLLPYEVTNAFWKAVVRGALSKEEAVAALREFEKFNLPLKSVPCEEAFKLASTYNISSYDAAYLALAESEKIPLVTADRRLHNAVGGRCKWLIWVEDYKEG